MIHWFLVGRGIMWFVFGLLPIFFSMAAGWCLVAGMEKTYSFFGSLALYTQLAVISVARYCL
jgi:hypothetical protein